MDQSLQHGRQIRSKKKAGYKKKSVIKKKATRSSAEMRSLLSQMNLEEVNLMVNDDSTL